MHACTRWCARETKRSRWPAAPRGGPTARVFLCVECYHQLSVARWARCAAAVACGGEAHTRVRQRTHSRLVQASCGQACCAPQARWPFCVGNSRNLPPHAVGVMVAGNCARATSCISCERAPARVWWGRGYQRLNAHFSPAATSIPACSESGCGRRQSPSSSSPAPLCRPKPQHEHLQEQGTIRTKSI